MKKTLAVALLLCLTVVVAQGAKTEAPKKKPDPAEDINKPRPDARRVAFTVDRATWMSVDLSPDGSTFLVDILGDIYTIPVAGGKATAITKGPAYDSSPRYSPDGKTIAFHSDRSGLDNLWLMDADGKNPRTLTTEKGNYVRGPIWSPDGQYVVARKEKSTTAGIPPVELWIYHLHGGSGVKLTSSDEITNSSGPTFSPDGRYLYFSARSLPFNYTANLTNGLWQIKRYDRRTGDTTSLTSGFGGAFRPLVTPDGKRMIFLSRRDHETVIVERTLASGAERVVARDVSRDEQEGFTQLDLWPGYAISRDGRTLYYENRGALTRLDLASEKSEVIPYSADIEHWYAPRVAWQERVETGPVKSRILRSASQTPDGGAVVFDSFGRLWIQRIANGKAVGDPQRVTPDDASLPRREYAPSISRDGQWITYVSWKDSEGGHVWKTRVPAAGAAPSTPQRLTTSPGHYANPEWSPKGDRIVIMRGSGQEFRGRQPEEDQVFEIRWLPASGGETEFVTSVSVGEGRFHPQAWWNNDGTRIFYRDFIPPTKPGESAKNDLTSIRPDGTDKRKLLRFPAIGDLVPSPDEQWVAFTGHDNVFVAALPNLIMKDPPEVGFSEGSVPVWRLSEDAGGYVDWADDGKTITWTLGGNFHRLPLKAAIAFVEAERRKAEAADKKDEPKPDAKKTGKEAPKEEEPKLKVPKSEAIAINVTMPRSVPSGSYVLRGARVITMKGNEVLENADVLVKDNRIQSVGANLTVPAGTREFDARGKTIIPGLIDSHAHLHYSSMELFPEVKWEYAANLAYGVTTTYDPSAPSLDVFAQAELVEAGMMIGPRIYSSGDILYGAQQAEVFAEVNDFDDARRQVRRMKAYGARMIKVYQQPKRSQRLWFAEASRELKMLLTAEGAGEMAADSTMATDGFTSFEHSLPIELQKDVVQHYANSGTYYTPTLIVAYGGPFGEQYFYHERNPHNDPKLRRFTPHFVLDPQTRRHPWIDPSEFHFPTIARGVADVLHAGGNISLGAHGQLQGLGPHWELWMMAGEGGKGGALTPHEALRAATISGADKLGFAPDLGSIEAGKLADLVVLDANPLEDIHNSVKIRWVIKNGVVYNGETLATEWPNAQPLPRFYWSE